MLQLHVPISNRLLRGVPARTLASLKPHMRQARLCPGDTLASPGFSSGEACFLLSGVASISAIDGAGEGIQVGHLGSEGMSSHTIVLRAEAGPFRTVVLSEGVGIFMPTDILRELAVKDRLLRAILLRYVDVCERQFLESAVSIGRYTIPQRLARWILMWQDRAELDTSDITHDVLAEMLGVRRPSITDAIHVLEGKGSIKSTRGQIAIRDRSRLRRVAGASYSTVC